MLQNLLARLFTLLALGRTVERLPGPYSTYHGTVLFSEIVIRKTLHFGIFSRRERESCCLKISLQPFQRKVKTCYRLAVT